MNAYFLVQLVLYQHSTLNCHKDNQYITVCPTLLNKVCFGDKNTDNTVSFVVWISNISA